MNRLLAAIAAGLVLAPAAVRAEPGLATEIYGPNVSRGETEFEVRSGILQGGDGDGEWQTKVELGHAVTDWWRPALVGEWEDEGEGTEFTAFALENVFDFVGTRDWPVHLGGYFEYEWKEAGADEVELKLLMQRARGPWKITANLIGETSVGAGSEDEWEFGYAAEGGYAINDDFRIGLQGFGDAGTNDDFGNLGEYGHYWGPFTQFELGHVGDGEIELQLGYLAGFGEAEADGQFRLKLEYEFGGSEHH